MTHLRRLRKASGSKSGMVTSVQLSSANPPWNMAQNTNCLRPTYICVLLYAAEWILTPQGYTHQPGAPSPTSLRYVRAHCSWRTASQEPVDSILEHPYGPLVLATTLSVIVLIHCRLVTPYGVGDPGQSIGCVVDRGQNSGIWSVQ